MRRCLLSFGDAAAVWVPLGSLGDQEGQDHGDIRAEYSALRDYDPHDVRPVFKKSKAAEGHESLRSMKISAESSRGDKKDGSDMEPDY